MLGFLGNTIITFSLLKGYSVKFLFLCGLALLLFCRVGDTHIPQIIFNNIF